MLLKDRIPLVIYHQDSFFSPANKFRILALGNTIDDKTKIIRAGDDIGIAKITAH